MYRRFNSSLLVVVAAGLASMLSLPASGQTNGRFFAVIDGSNLTQTPNTGSQPFDSARSVVFFDANTGDKMFSVAMPFERAPTATDLEDPQALTVDPRTGDVYVLAFDSGTPGTYEAVPPGGNGILDTSGDLDLFRINFSTVYSDWVSNGKVTQTYNSYNNFIAPPTPPANTGHHALPTKVLAGAVTKIGEVVRNDPTPAIFDYGIQFVNKDTLLLMDNGRSLTLTDPPQDFTIRALNRVSPLPNGPVGSDGYNSPEGAGVPNAETWVSKILGRVNLDSLDGSDRSEPYSFAYHKDPASGVEGLWILENDGGANNTGEGAPASNGDQVGFFQITSFTSEAGNAYRPFGDASTSFRLSDDASFSVANGKGNGIYVDRQGNLVFVEDGFFDTNTTMVEGSPVTTPNRDEPAGIKRTVTSYNDAGGTISFGSATYSQLDLSMLTDDDGSDDVTDSRLNGYDPVNNILYYIDQDTNFTPPGDGSGSSDWDLYALDLDTGVSSLVKTNVDSMVLFQSFNGRSAIILFQPGDVDLDGDCDIDDYNAVQNNMGAGAGGDADGDGDTDLTDYQLVRDHFGQTIVLPVGMGAGSVTAVPEPASLLLLAIGGAALALVRRRK